MKEIEVFIGPCSKFIAGQGWTTEVPVEQIKAKGYRKESDTAKEIFEWFEKHCFFNGFEIVEAYFKEHFGVEVE